MASQLRPFLPLLRHWHWGSVNGSLGVVLTFDDDQTEVELVFTGPEILAKVVCFRIGPDRSALVWLLQGRERGGWTAGALGDGDDPTLLKVALQRRFAAERVTDLSALVWEARIESQVWRRTFLR